jgi:hypothetical protein
VKDADGEHRESPSGVIHHMSGRPDAECEKAVRLIRAKGPEHFIDCKKCSENSCRRQNLTANHRLSLRSTTCVT